MKKILLLSFNPSRAELYFRKALHIREKDKNVSNLASGQQTSNANFNAARNISATYRSNDSLTSEMNKDNVPNKNSARSITSTASTGKNGVQEQQNTRHSFSEEQNTIAEILFDLGCLLATYESHISKREAIEYLRRSLDIKTLILGLNHSDCFIIKKRLNEIVAENINSLTQQNHHLLQRSQSTIHYGRQDTALNELKPSIRPTSSIKSYPEVSPKQRLNKYINEFKQKYEFNSSDMTGASTSLLDQWVRKNSIIEVIPSKLDMKKRELLTSPPMPEASIQQLYEQSEFIITLVESSENQTNSKIVDLKPIQTNQNRTMKNSYSALSPSLTKQNMTSKILASSLSVGLAKEQKQKSERRNTNNIRLSLNNHANFDNLLINAPNSRDNKLKVYKNIYYQTAWLDHPPGSVKSRFKNFIKVASNA